MVHALAETIFPTDGIELPSVDEAEVVEYFDDLLAHLPLKEKFLIRCLIALLELQPLAFNGLRPKLFTHATVEERTSNLAGWETSRIFQRRLVFMAIRTILLFSYVDSQEMEEGMGLRPGTRVTQDRKAAQLAAARRAISEARGEGSSELSDRDDEPASRLHTSRAGTTHSAIEEQA